MYGRRSGRKDRCQKGKSCGLSCIQSIKACLVDSGKMVNASLGKLKSLISGRKSSNMPMDKKYQDVRKRLMEMMQIAAYNQNIGSYSKLEKRLISLDQRFAKRFKISEPYNTPGSLWNKMSAARGQKRDWDRHVAMANIRERMYQAAYKGDRKTYDKLEAGLLKAQARAEKAGVKNRDAVSEGQIWRAASDVRGTRMSRQRLGARAPLKPTPPRDYYLPSSRSSGSGTGRQSAGTLR